MEKIRLTVQQISCHHCVNTIKRELMELKGVVDVAGDPKAKEVEISFEQPVTLEKIKDVLKEIGYPAKEL